VLGLVPESSLSVVQTNTLRLTAVLVGLLAGLLACKQSTESPTAPACPEDMVLIPAGSAVLGHPAPNRRWQEPQQSRVLNAYCIDRYEYPNQAGKKPRTEVSWEEAQALCAAQSKRLCSSDEWERACRGAEGWSWSYGDRFDPKRCNTPLQGRDGPGEEALPIAPAGSFEQCRSPEGVHDLNGNVSEWVADPWNFEAFGTPDTLTQAAALDEHPPPGAGVEEEPSSFRTLRGGTMWSETFYGQSCHSRHGHPRTSPSDDDGFRCCQSTP
jgi:formylglycine-generating enzyme required for sulfatase activity